MSVGERREWDAVGGAVQGVCEGEADVVVAQGVGWGGGEVGVEICAVSPVVDFDGSWASIGVPGVEVIAPCAEPMTGKGPLNDFFDFLSLFEARFCGVDVRSQMV